MFELFIARRYLSAKRKQVVLSVITVISVMGVAAGVMALVIALAINNGFRNTLQDNLLSATAHVSILNKESGIGIEGWEQTAERLSHLPHVTNADPALYDVGFVSGVTGEGSNALIKGIAIKPGVIPKALPPLKSGSAAALLPAEGDLPGIILGSRMAEKIGAVTGKPVQMLIANGEMTPLGMKPSVVRLRVAGTFETGTYDIDSNWAYMALPAVQKVYGLSDVVNSIEVKLDDIYAAPDVAKAAEAVIGSKLAATTWQEQNRQILNALRMERVVTYITIGMILVVAAFNILITLVMMGMEKFRDIAILMSLGARADQIRRIFLWQGALIGGVGTALGMIVGYTVCYFADHYRLLRLDEAVYPLSWVPFEPRWLDGLWIAGIALLVSVVATLYPARNATKIAPVEALRYE